MGKGLYFNASGFDFAAGEAGGFDCACAIPM
jgi:hypothetical protein